MRTNIHSLVTVCLMCAFTAAHAAPEAPEVSVSGGKIRGSSAGFGGAVFKGIRFAQPPIGELRWREPAPVKAWAGVYEAATFGAPCTQGGAEAAKSSEDCLLSFSEIRWS